MKSRVPKDYETSEPALVRRTLSTPETYLVTFTGRVRRAPTVETHSLRVTVKSVGATLNIQLRDGAEQDAFMCIYEGDYKTLSGIGAVYNFMLWVLHEALFEEADIRSIVRQE